MKRILSMLALLLTYSSTSWAVCLAGGTCGAATRYDVDVQEMAICQDAACANKYVVGSGRKVLDIASASIGAEVGKYADVDSIPYGTYTHVRLLVSPTFIITGGVVGACPAQNAATLTIPNGAPIDALAGGAIPGMSWSDGTKTKVQVLVALSAPITVGTGFKCPGVKIQFDTQGGLMCHTGVSFPAPPDITFIVGGPNPDLRRAQ